MHTLTYTYIHTQRLNKDELSELIEEMKHSESSKSSAENSDFTDGLADEQCDPSNNDTGGDKRLTYNPSTNTLLTLAGISSTTDSTASTSPDLDYISDHNSETTLTEKITDDTDSIDSTSSVNSLVITNFDEPRITGPDESITSPDVLDTRDKDLAISNCMHIYTSL